MKNKINIKERKIAKSYWSIMIKKANLEEAKLIYKEHMENDFPPDELPEYKKYMYLTEKNIHEIYLYEKENVPVAYFITVEDKGNILITHLAVIKEFRSKGIGKVLLNEIKEYFKNKKMLIVEVEAESRANNKEELEIINKRKRYYLKSDFVQCDNMRYVLFNVEYDILVCGLNKCGKVDNYEIKEIMEKIYTNLRIDNSKLKIELN